MQAGVNDEGIRIAVKDTGCGIDTDDLEHIFDRYYSGSGPRTRRRKRGTGLGLADQLGYCTGTRRESHGRK